MSVRKTVRTYTMIREGGTCRAESCPRAHLPPNLLCCFQTQHHNHPHITFKSHHKATSPPMPQSLLPPLPRHTVPLFPNQAFRLTYSDPPPDGQLQHVCIHRAPTPSLNLSTRSACRPKRRKQDQVKAANVRYLPVLDSRCMTIASSEKNREV